MRVDFPELEVARARASRERAEAVYALIIAPIARFFSRAPREKASRPVTQRRAAA